MISITGSQIISNYYKHTNRNNKQLIIWVASATAINNYYPPFTCCLSSNFTTECTFQSPCTQSVFTNHNHVCITSTATLPQLCIHHKHSNHIWSYSNTVSLVQLSVCVQVQVTAHLKQHKRSDSSLQSPTHHNPASCQQSAMHVCCHGRGGPLRVLTHQAQHGLGKAC